MISDADFDYLSKFTSTDKMKVIGLATDTEFYKPIKCTKQNLAESKTETKPETNTKTEIKEAPEVKKSESHSYFDDLRGKLMRAGLKSEIIMIRHNEAESEESEITEQAEQTEQEEED